MSGVVADMPESRAYIGADAVFSLAHGAWQLNPRFSRYLVRGGSGASEFDLNLLYQFQGFESASVVPYVGVGGGFVSGDLGTAARSSKDRTMSVNVVSGVTLFSQRSISALMQSHYTVMRDRLNIFALSLGVSWKP